MMPDMTEQHPPILTSTPAKHSQNSNEAGLMIGMADRLGVSVAQATHSGIIEPKQASEMTHQCNNCTRHDDCILWLMEHQKRQEETPDYCLNSNELKYIRAVQNGVR